MRLRVETEAGACFRPGAAPKRVRIKFCQFYSQPLLLHFPFNLQLAPLWSPARSISSCETAASFCPVPGLA